MKKDIHPKYNPKAKFICVCGQEYIVGSTKDEIHIEVCAACHPFFTGKQKLVDTARRVEKFHARTALKKETTTLGKTAKRKLKETSRKAKASEK